ncbi:hypothetical protein PHMEG_0007857 [Phytophthora megakarya]|uniref:Uncharacterized protein n=1 Tax=Phytophthora megakarya TaxID=4795 RepID=A0A225WKL6_9STRA|nr:hypothetical protein PHMEG_0007857 [Phytophthora megakarya]
MISKNVRSVYRNSSTVGANSNTSSTRTIADCGIRGASLACTWFWKYSAESILPCGTLVGEKTPSGVMNEHISRLSSCRGIC